MANEQPPPKKPIPSWIVAVLVTIGILVIGFGICVAAISGSV